MILTVASHKGGVGKTTTAVHLAGYFQDKGRTLLIDGDPNRSATGWAKRGQLPFRVIDERQAARFAREYEHVVIDTEARPDEEDLKSLADGCDLLIIPSCPDALSLDALLQTTAALEKIGGRFKVLLTIIPPKPSKDGDEARATLSDCGLPLFAGGIRRLAAFQKAALAGVLISSVDDPRAQLGWGDYLGVGEEVCR